MDNAEYVNHYVEIMTNTMTDAVVRNVSLQAQLKINEKVINELQTALNDLQQTAQDNTDNGIARIKELEDEISKLKSEIQSLSNMKSEYENVKHQVQHVDTFRKELISARKETEEVRLQYQEIIDGLNKKIEYLQMTPAKRKKFDEQNAPVVAPTQLPITDSEIKDGGKF
jgi:chromosome segregation ATPase